RAETRRKALTGDCQAAALARSHPDKARAFRRPLLDHFDGCLSGAEGADGRRSQLAAMAFPLVLIDPRSGAAPLPVVALLSPEPPPVGGDPQGAFGELVVRECSQRHQPLGSG